MSRRRREERARAAAPAREAYLAAREAEARAGAAPARRSRTWPWLVLAIGLAAAGAVIYALVIEPWRDRRQLLGQQGRPVGAAFGEGTLAIIDGVDVEHEHPDDPRRTRRVVKTRVTVLDSASGAVLEQRLFEGDGGCVTAAPGRLWCDLGGLALHDARTFARLAGADELIARAGLARPVAGRWRVDGAVATWALDDGRAATIDAVAMTARGSDFVPRELRPGPTGLAPADGALRRAPGCAGLVEPRRPGKPQSIATRGTWMIVELGGRSQVLRQGTTTSASFLSPGIVGFVDDTPVIVHHAAVEPGRDHALVSRLGGGGGEPAWTVPLGGACVAAAVLGPRVVVVSDDPARRAVALDAATGAVAWSYAP